jgi:predicted DNA-binding protein
MKTETLLLICAIVFIVAGVTGGIVGFAICNKTRVEPLQTIIDEAEQKQQAMEKQIDQLAREREEAIREAIEKMDPADVIDRYLSESVQQRLTHGADQYTKRIVESVFEWLAGYIRDESGAPGNNRANSPGDH